MNRNQRRQLEKQQNKEIAVYNSQNKWLENLQPNQKSVIDHMIREAKVDAEIECVAVVDKILTGVLFERTDMNWKESYDFNVAFGRYYAEYKFNVARVGKEKRLKMLNGLENEIVSKVQKWIAEGKGKVEIVKLIKNDYKGVGLISPEINNVYQRTFEEYKDMIKEIEPKLIREMVEYLNKNITGEEIQIQIKSDYPLLAEKDVKGIYILAKDEFMKPKHEDYTDVPYVGAESEARSKEKRKAKKEADKKQQESEEQLKESIIKVGNAGKKVLEGFNKVVKEKKMSNLKVVNEVVKVVSRELEGEFGKYIADENGVTREDVTFKDFEAVEAYKKEQLEKFEREVAELEAVFTFREN